MSGGKEREREKRKEKVKTKTTVDVIIKAVHDKSVLRSRGGGNNNRHCAIHPWFRTKSIAQEYLESDRKESIYWKPGFPSALVTTV